MTNMRLAFLFLLIMVTATTVKPQYCSWSLPPPYHFWLNTWKNSFTAHCPAGSSLSVWYTYFRQCQRDRIHHFKCRYTPAHRYHETCAWSSFLNSPAQYYFKRCINDAYIAGISSQYDSFRSDRRIKLLCCRVHGYRMRNCFATHYINYFRQSFSYTVPYGYTLVGVGSSYSYYSRDRIWRFYLCQMS